MKICPRVTMEQCVVFFFLFPKFGQYCLTPHQIRISSYCIQKYAQILETVIFNNNYVKNHHTVGCISGTFLFKDQM